MGAARDQAKTVCGNLQLCAGVEAGIEGATHTVRQRRLKRVWDRKGDEEEVEGAEEEECEGGEVLAGINNLTIEMMGYEEEAAEGLKAALEMGVEEDR